MSDRPDPVPQHTGLGRDGKVSPSRAVVSVTAVRSGRVLIVDDHAASRGDMCAALAHQPHLHVIGEAADGSAAIALARNLKPDVVVVSLRLADMSGIAITRHLVRLVPTTRVVIMSMVESEQLVVDAMAAGAWGFLPRTIALDAFTRAISGVIDGEVALSRRAAGWALAQLRQPLSAEPKPAVKLTKRETEVVLLLAEGATDRQIAQHLTIEESTAKKHVQHILRKLRARNRSEAVARYLSDDRSVPD